MLPHVGQPFLDALRGFAIAGIVLVNIPDMTHMEANRTVLDLTVQTRFVPIFEFLFGIGMWFIVRGARERGLSPWPPMVLRLVALFAIGSAPGLVYPGEVLSAYAVSGLVVLPVVVLAPRWLQLGLAAAVAVTVLVLAGSSSLETPGIVLLGAAAAAYGVPVLLDRGARPVLVVFAVAVVLCVPALWLQDPGDPRFTDSGGRAGFVMAIGYVTGLSLLWATPVRRVIAAVLEPIGRMALTNYAVAALVAVPAGLLLGFSPSPTLAPALVLGAVLIAAQSASSRLWLRHFRLGPIEWVWRAVTWRTWPRPTGLPSRYDGDSAGVR